MSTTFFDNTTQPHNLGTQIGIFGTQPFNSFSVPNSSPKWKLNTCKLVVVGSGLCLVNVNLYNDNGANSPGTLNTNLVANFAMNLVANVPTLVDLSAAIATPTLTPGRYWLELDDPTNTGTNWQDPNNNVGAQGTGVAGEFNGEFIGFFVAANNNVNSPAAQMLLGGDPVVSSPPWIIDQNSLRILHFPNPCCERELCVCMSANKEFLFR